MAQTDRPTSGTGRPIDGSNSYAIDSRSSDCASVRASSPERRIVWLGENEAHDVSLTGGKGAALSRLADRYRVPHGFCITAPALAPIDRNATSLPAHLLASIAEAYDLLHDEREAPQAVAVRSSAIDEDGRSCSFAGLHETFLNVQGLDEIADAVVRCVASGRTERAQHYRRTNGLDPHAPIAVVIQRLIRADVAAVAFSADPVTGDRNTIVINASWGLGESIVGGTVTPDVYRIDAGNGRVIAHTPGTKERMTIVAEKGTMEVDVPRFLREEPPLSDAQAAEIAAMVRSLEHTAGMPVDVECALYGDELWLLQCRPITTLRSAAG